MNNIIEFINRNNKKAIFIVQLESGVKKYAIIDNDGKVYCTAMIDYSENNPAQFHENMIDVNDIYAIFDIKGNLLSCKQ